MTTISNLEHRPHLRTALRTTHAQSPVTGQQLLAALLGLLFILVPAANALSPAAGDYLAAGAAAASIIPILTRANRVPRLTAAFIAFLGLYAIGAVFFGAGQPGVAERQALTTAAAGAALLLFTTYGREMTSYFWFRHLAYLCIAAGLITLPLTGQAKNLLAGSAIYLGALLISLLIVRRPHATWRYGTFMFVGAATLAYFMDFRAMIAYTLVLLLALWGARILSARQFFWTGLLGIAGVIGGLTWYFLNAYTSRLAIDLSRAIETQTGRRATSGRDWLWPNIMRQNEGDELLGSGVGKLPRDFLPTDFSSHSSYMQTYLQVGLVGVVLLALVLLAIWSPLAAQARDPRVRFGAALFLMFVLHNGTEVLMFQTGLIASIPAWCAIGLALSETVRPGAMADDQVDATRSVRLKKSTASAAL